MSAIQGELLAESCQFKDVIWKISNFFQLPTIDGYCVESPKFSFENATWCLRLRPNGDIMDDSSGYIDFLLVRLHSSVPKHSICCKLGLKTRRGKEYQSSVTKKRFDQDGDVGKVLRYLQWDFIDVKKKGLAPEDTLTVFCEMRVNIQQFGEASCELLETSVQEEEVQEGPSSAQKLQMDYKKLLQSGEDCDVRLMVSGNEFRVHKCILRARSSVFNAMFKHETEEKASGEVVIDDLDPDAFPGFLEYVYTGHVEDLCDENAFSLYLAADKYDTQELKSECREYMQRTLSVSTFCDVMTVAQRYQEKELMKLAIDFFSKNLAKIIVTVKWQVFLKDYPTESNELLVKVLVPREGK